MPLPFLAELLSNSPQLCALVLVLVLLLSALWLVRPELVDMALGIAQLGFDKANAKISFDLSKIGDALAGDLDDPLDLQGMRRLKDVKGKASAPRAEQGEQALALLVRHSADLDTDAWTTYPGLVNGGGNSCFLNATLQVRSLPLLPLLWTNTVYSSPSPPSPLSSRTSKPSPRSATLSISLHPCPPLSCISSESSTPLLPRDAPSTLVQSYKPSTTRPHPGDIS
jgi:hypothetical protein